MSISTQIKTAETLTAEAEEKFRLLISERISQFVQADIARMEPLNREKFSKRIAGPAMLLAGVDGIPEHYAALILRGTLRRIVRERFAREGKEFKSHVARGYNPAETEHERAIRHANEFIRLARTL